MGCLARNMILVSVYQSIPFSVRYGFAKREFNFRLTADNPTGRKIEARGRICDGGTIEPMRTADRRNAQTPIMETKKCQFADGETRKLEVKETKLFKIAGRSA